MPTVAFVETSLSGSGMDAMRHARDLGCAVVFLTRDPGYYAGHDSLDLAELRGFATVRRCDTNAVGPIVSALGGAVDAVLSPGEHHVALAAEVAHRIGAAGASWPAAAVARDKVATMRRCAAAGVPVPRHAAVTRLDEVGPAVRRIGLPLVVKPADGTASLDVRLCHTHADVHDAVAAVLRREFSNRGQRCLGTAVLAAYVEGPEYSVETLGRHVFGVTAKRVGPPPHRVETAHAFPAPLSEPEARACVDMALRGLRAIGLRHGAAHTEVILGPDGPVLLEVNARPAGDRITELVALATGVDPLREWVRAHLPGTSVPAPTVRRAAAIRFLTPPAGVVTAVGDLGPLRGAEGVRRLSVGLRPGDVVDVQRSSHDRPGFVVTTAPTAGDALTRADAVHDRLPITVVPRAGVRP